MHHRRAALLSLCLVWMAFGVAPTWLGNDAAIAAAFPDRLSPRLQRVLASTSDGDAVLAWVFLTDKGTASKQRIPRDVVSPRSLARRAKVMPLGKRVQSQDLPVAQAYVAAIANNVQQVRNRSRWFNAVSVRATRAQLLTLAELPFVIVIE